MSSTTTPPTYRERLRVEGAVLAACGALASVLLLAFVSESRERAGSTIGQVVFVALALALLGPLSARRWLAAAQPACQEPVEQVLGAGCGPSRPPTTFTTDSQGAELTGQPTPLWMPPLVVVVLVGAFVLPGALGVGAVGWDAGLRIALGCMLVGLTQALLLAQIVAADEKRNNRRYLRLPGSRAIGGTKLGFFSHMRM